MHLSFLKCRFRRLACVYSVIFLSSTPPPPTPYQGIKDKCQVKQTGFSTLSDVAVLPAVARVQCGVPRQREAMPSRDSRCWKLTLRKRAHVLRFTPLQCNTSTACGQPPGRSCLCSLLFVREREHSHRLETWLELPCCPLHPLETHGQACEEGTHLGSDRH